MTVQTTYRLDTEASELSFSARAMFGTATVRGTFAVTGGEVTVEPDGGIRVAAVVAADSVDTGLAKRDEHIVSSDYLGAREHPEIRFSGSAPAGATAGRGVLRGELTVAGRTRPVDLDLGEVVADGRGAVAEAAVEIDRYEFGVTAGKGMTGRRITVRIRAVATPAA
ncbi:YceI family protein [Pseudonocardia pini]|uniref:YceI family protein n=1 Tax=Pseudonocardia pini TaxID=2758030 RepID=UPI0015F08B45|nr:YceI family protein [Pseudonocardia pini]